MKLYFNTTVTYEIVSKPKSHWQVVAVCDAINQVNRYLAAEGLHFEARNSEGSMYSPMAIEACDGGAINEMETWFPVRVKATGEKSTDHVVCAVREYDDRTCNLIDMVNVGDSHTSWLADLELRYS